LAPMESENLIKALSNLAYTPVDKTKHEAPGSKIMEVIDALVASGDPALLEQIPPFLALCGKRGFSLNIKAFLSRYGSTSQQTETLEKLLLISLGLLKEEGFQLPSGSGKTLKSLETKYGDLSSANVLELSEGVSLQIDRIRKMSKKYASGRSDPESIKRVEEHWPLGSSPSQLHHHLRLLFSPKQEELIMKKLKGDTFTKTEREYYSRVVKKKLKVLAYKPLHELASKLISS